MALTPAGGVPISNESLEGGYLLAEVGGNTRRVSSGDFTSIANMAASTKLFDGQTVYANGEAFTYDAASTATADGALIVVATGMGVGRLISTRKTHVSVSDFLTGDFRGYETYIAGDIVEAGGFRYEVAASGAIDHHKTTPGGVKVYVERVGGAWPMKAWGFVDDYYQANGISKNATPADNSVVFQEMVDAGVGYCAAVVDGAYAFQTTILNPGILHLKSPEVVTDYVDAFSQKNRTFVLSNSTAEMFDTDPDHGQSAFNVQGFDMDFGASGSFHKVSDKTAIIDYVNIHMRGCRTFGGTGNAIDGTLGSFLWVIEDNIFGSQGYHDVALRLHQPHGAIISGNQFSFRNVRDVVSTGGGVATYYANNSNDADVEYKICCLDIENFQSWEIRGNYCETYNYTPETAVLVNSGRGPEWLRFSVSHSNPDHIPVVDNNYLNMTHSDRVIVIRRVAAEENLNSKATPVIGPNNTFHNLKVGAATLYHEQTGTGTLTIPRPQVDTLNSVRKIEDPNSTLFVYGHGARYVAQGTYTNFVGNGYIDWSDVAAMVRLRNDRIAYLDGAPNYRLRTATGRYRFTFHWHWTSAVALGDWNMRIYESAPSSKFSTRQILQTGTSGYGTEVYEVCLGQLAYFAVRPAKTTLAATPICDTLNVRVVLESLDI